MKKELGRQDESDERWCGEESRGTSKFKRGVSQLGMNNTSLTSLLGTRSVSSTQKQERMWEHSRVKQKRLMDIMFTHSETSVLTRVIRSQMLHLSDLNECTSPMISMNTDGVSVGQTCSLSATTYFSCGCLELNLGRK